MASPTQTWRGSPRRGRGVGFATDDSSRAPKVAQVLPNNNQLDKPSNHPHHHHHQGTSHDLHAGSQTRSPRRERVMSPRARIGDGSEDVGTITDGHQHRTQADIDAVDISNLDLDQDQDQFYSLAVENTFSQTDWSPNKTLMEVKDSRKLLGQDGQSGLSPHRAEHPLHPMGRSPVQQSAHHYHPQYKGAYGEALYSAPVHGSLPEYQQYYGQSKFQGSDSRTTGNPVPFHIKMNLSQWQQNLESQLSMQQKMQQLHLEQGYHPSVVSGTGLDLHRRGAAAGYQVGESNYKYGVMPSDSSNMEGLIRAKENMLHERNIVIERQKLEITHLRKQNEEQEAIARHRLLARSREEGDMLFLKMQEYQYEIASLRAQLAEVSTAKMAEGEQLSRKLGEVEESQLNNEQTIRELRKELRVKESEVQDVKGQLTYSKRDYEKLKKRLGKVEKYMHDLPTAEEYKESTETIKDLQEQERLLQERIVSLEASLKKAKHRARKGEQEALELQDRNQNLQAETERLKQEMGRLQAALGAEKTGDPTDLELFSRNELTQLRAENEQYATSVEHLKKVIDSKHRQAQKVHADHQRAVEEVETRLLQEEGVATALRVELKDKDRSMKEMTTSMKELAATPFFVMDEIPATSNEEILSAIHALQRRVDTCTSAAQQPKLLPTFKSEGNKQQFEHSKKVEKLVERGITLYEQGDFDKTVQTLKEALRELKNRQKLIRIADRSPLGWSTVNEYVADELADDSGDEKRLRKAEKAASAKRAESAAKKPTRGRPRPYPRPAQRPLGSFRRFPATFMPNFQHRYDNRVCFQCGIAGHVRTSCPAIRASRHPMRQQPGPPGVTQ